MLSLSKKHEDIYFLIENVEPFWWFSELQIKKYYLRSDFLLCTEVMLASKKQRGCQIFRNNGMCKVIQATVAASLLILVGLSDF